MCREELAVMEKKICRTKGTWKGARDLPGWRGHSTRGPFLGTSNPVAAETDWNSILHSFCVIYLCLSGQLSCPGKVGTSQMDSESLSLGLRSCSRQRREGEHEPAISWEGNQTP